MKNLLFGVLVTIMFVSNAKAEVTNPYNGGNEEERCRHWYITFFGYQILDHANDDCGTKRNWNWF